nr:hypothetical protein [Tanacetum cinerariifolium]
GRLSAPATIINSAKISFEYHVPLGFSSIAGGLDHLNPVIRLPIKCGISRVLVLIQANNRPGKVKPKISTDVNIEISNNFMRELRRKLLVGTVDEDAYEHVQRVLEIVDMFHFPGVTHDAVMLKVFPITLKGRALRHLKEQICSPYRTREIVCMIENPREVHKLKDQEDEGDMDVGWEITVKGVERLQKLLTPTIHTLPNPEPVLQPYMSLRPVHDKEKIVLAARRQISRPSRPIIMWARVVGLSWKGVEIHGRSSGSGGEGRGNHERVDMGLVGNLVKSNRIPPPPNTKAKHRPRCFEGYLHQSKVVYELDRSLFALGPNRLCARVPLEDDMPFHTQACIEYTRWVFYRLCGRLIVHLLVYLTRKHGFDLWSFQGFFSSHD